ncbi:MAG: phosphatidylglycerophosphatase A [Mariprofundales bacterium]|nr:phosphatidylglycerophosphatase A [Mariprofundales bacterium]
MVLITSRPFEEWIAAGLGSGWLPKAPGTWGSLAALLPGWWILQLAGVKGLLLAVVLVTLLGCLVCWRVLPQMEDQDPGWIVVDEWAGQWLTLAIGVLVMGQGIPLLLAAFVAFRAFDIFKPWPIRSLEHLGPGWWSIMADDLMAGVFAGAVIFAAGGLEFAL